MTSERVAEKPAVTAIYRLAGDGNAALGMIRVFDRARRVPHLEHGRIGWVAMRASQWLADQDKFYLVCAGSEHPDLVSSYVDTFQGRVTTYGDLTGVDATDMVVVVATLQ